MSITVVFMGSPDFALPTLRRLTESSDYTIIGVVTQPDRPAGRGQQLTPPPVKTLALSLGLEVIQPERLRRPEAQEKLQAWSPDLIVVTAFGQILRQNVLDLPRYGCINVHASLLPRWRGAAPIQAAILNGDVQTGATIMRMDPGIDTGPMLAQRALDILPEDTTGTLAPRLAEAGADLLIETLPGYLAGKITPQIQDECLATYAPMIQKEEGLLDFTQPAAALVNRVRAFQPWPGAYTHWQDQPLKIQRARALISPDAHTGSRAVIESLPAIGAADGWLLLEQLQPAGKRSMSGRDFLSGARSWATNP
ncbi:MAG: methionyl-tRNA formyltransferase [Anaerolineaceae bacterium]|nr:methionyl-tRNA formyltransferase [Anaerolineaceae bacterium]